MSEPGTVTTESSPSSDLTVLTQDTIRIYTWGFRISLALVLVGLLVGFIRDEPLSPSLGSPVYVFNEFLSGHSDGILGVGILVMILTPLVGAISIATNFFRIGDRRFGYFTVTIVFILMFSAATSYLY